MSKYILKKFKGGISDWEEEGIKGAFKFARNLDIRKKRDTLSVKQGLTDDLALGGVMNSSVVQAVVSSDGNSYWGLANGKILKRTSAGVWSLVYTDAENVLYGLGEWVNDNGETGIYWATATKLHRKPIPGSASWTDVDVSAGSPAQTYPKTNLTSTTNHFMKISNGVFLICNKNTLAMVGYDESYTNQALQFIPGNMAQSILDLGDTALIATNREDATEQSWVYKWDGIAQNYLSKTPVPISDVNAMVETEFILIQFGTNGGVHFFGTSTKIPVLNFPDGGKTEPSGVTVFDAGLAYMGVYNNGTGKTGIYSYGRKAKNDSLVLNLEYGLDCDAIYALQSIGTDLLIAYKSGSQYGVKVVDTDTKASSGYYQSLVLDLNSEDDRDRVLGNITVECAELPAGCSIEIWRRLNRVNTGGTDYTGTLTGDDDGWYQCALVDDTGSLSTTGATKGIFRCGDEANYVEVMAVLNCSGNLTPEVYKIIIDFD